VANQGSGVSSAFSNGFYLSNDATITAGDVRLDGNANLALGPGGSFDWGAPTLTIPAGTAPGTYYLGILVDENNGTPESNEGNNYKSVAITVVAPLADLVISAPASLVASPPSVLPGGHVTLSPWTVMNQGSGASNDFVNGFYLSSDAVITASDVRLDGNGNTALAPGASFSWGGPTLTIPAGTAPGTYYLGILVDETNGTPESNEGNNYKSVQITVLAPLADLVISAPASLVANPSSVLPGGQVSLSAWTVANQGSVASNAFSNGFYLSSDAVITASDVRLDGNGNTALAPGASFAWGGPTLTIPAGTAPGNYYIGILVDENNGTPDSNEGNNYKSVAITVLAPIADLTISAPATLVVAPATVVRGGSVVLSAWTVKNQGTVASNAFSNGFYLSTDAVITASDLRLDGNANFALAAGASFSWGGPTLTIPASVAPGIYYIGILVDENNGTPESNEANNYKSVALVVTASLADLVISAPASLVASPPVINAGGRVALSAWTVMNQGVVSSNAFSNGFYLSTDAVITSADVRLDGNSNFALAPGGSFAWGGPTVTIPAGTAPGNYYLGILVDENNGTPESNEANNYKSVAITVVAPLLRYPFEGNANNVGAQAGYNGSTTNATFPAGKFGLAVKFDGSATTGATFPGTGALLGSGSKWTISLWFREDVLQPTSWLFDIRVTTPGAERGWETYHGVTTGFITSCSVGGCYSFATPATAVWHNLIYRYDGASATVGAPVQIYVDGALSGEITNASLLPLIAPGVGDMLLGNVRRVPTGSGGLFYVDELRVYDAVFTIAQQCTLIIGGTWNGSSCALP
jgi:subtilase family serine protease